MKRLFAAALALLSSVALAATTTPISLLSPTGSTAGQAIISSGPSSAPAWGSVTLGGVSGTLAVANGGTGATSASAARTSLGLGTAATQNTGTSGATVPLLNGVNTWGAAQTFSVRPTFNGATPWDSANLIFATPPAIGGTTPAAAAFTTLGASGNDALLYQTTTAQSVANGTATTITNWTKVSDRVNANFNATTGTFTAPVAGNYWVAANITYAVTTGGAGISQGIRIVGNGVTLASQQIGIAASTTSPQTVTVSALVSLTAGQTIVVQGFQNSGASVALAVGSAYNNSVSIARIP